MDAEQKHLEYLGIWEILYNPAFKPFEFEGFKKQAGLNAFTLSPQKWIEATNAAGIISKSGRCGGTYAHKDIAFKFAAWISVEFELYLIKEFQRLKEAGQKLLGWSAKRELPKINYHIHTDAIKENLIPKELTPNSHDSTDETTLERQDGVSHRTEQAFIIIVTLAVNGGLQIKCRVS